MKQQIQHKKKFPVLLQREGAPHVMLLLPVLLVFVYRYLPMPGILLAFNSYKPRLGIFGSPWVGLDNFRLLLGMSGFIASIKNTLIIASGKIIMGILVPVCFSLMLNEINQPPLKRVIQTIVYLPHFISWVLLAGIITRILNPYGVVNQFLITMGMEPHIFLADKKIFPGLMVFLDVWKGFGYGSIVYLAAITGIDPNLYEAASIDGAGRWRQTIHITLPGLAPMIVLMTTLSLGSILDGGFDQIFNLYSPVVLSTGDIIDTFLYRMAFENAQFSISTAAGLFKSAIGCFLIVLSYKLAYKLTGYRVF
ncbi:protein lplB [Spirochaetia bacterium]|nr:protein lplB [Spirochaetia bacterium]